MSSVPARLARLALPLAVLAPLGLVGASSASAATRELRPASVGARVITFKLSGLQPRAIRSATLLSAGGKRSIRRSTVRRAARSGVLKLRRPAARSMSSMRRRTRLIVVTDTTAPRVSWGTLKQGATISGVLSQTNGKCLVHAHDNVGVVRVGFYLDGSHISSDAKAPFACHWDTRTAKRGKHVLSAIAVDSANHTTTTSVGVLVNQSGSVTPSPGPSPFQNLVFEDNFDGSAVNTASWSPYNSPGHAGNGLRRSSAFSVSDGLLAVTASWDGTNITSGGMSHRANYQYGRFEVRVRTEPDPTGQLSGVVLTWPQSNKWIPDGENDIYETGLAPSRSPFYSYVHYNTDGVNNLEYNYAYDASAADWHTMRMDWTPDSITFYRDGVLTHTLTDAVAIRDVPHHLSVQLDAFSNRPLAGPVKMYVDWVKVYK